MYFDTHAHYDEDRFDEDRDSLIASLPENGVELAVNIGCSLSSALKSVALAEKYPHIYATVGCHPHDSAKMKDSDLLMFRQLAKRPKVVAIGEIGLDYHYDFSPRDIQKQRFIDQLELAAELDMPVVIHEREAHEDCLKIVQKYAPKIRGVYHSYSGSLETAKILIKLGWYLAFNGIITFKSARRSLEVVRWMPLDRLMLETDCPYLAPEPFRGKRNSSLYVYRVAEKIAEERGMDKEEIARLTLENGKRFYGIL